MIKKIKSILISLTAVITFALTAAIPATVMAVDCTSGTSVDPNSTNTCLCQGSNIDFSNATANQNCDNGSSSVGKLIRTIINVLSVVIGAIAVIMIIIGGFRYITSGGNDTSVTAAKNTILYAIIGLVVVALAQIIVRFTLSKLTNS